MTYTAKTAKELRSEKGSLSKKLATQLGLIETELDGINRAAASYTLSKALALGVFGDATGLALSDDLVDALGIYAELPATGTALTAGKVAAGMWSRFLVNKAQTNDVSLFGMEAQMRVKANLGDGVHASLWAYFEQSGTVTLASPGMNGAISVTVEGSAGLTVASGAYLAGMVIDSSVASGAIMTGSFDAINIKKSGSSYAWKNGICIRDNAATTGVSIGACTTGIDIVGAVTRGIRVGTHDWGVGSTGLEISTTDPLLQVAGKVTGEDVAQGVYVCSYNQLALINDQDEDVSMMASWNELYVTDADLTGSSNYAAVWGHIEAAGTVVSSTGNMSPLHGSLIIPANYTNASGALLGGCIVDIILHTSMTNNGVIAAFAIGSHTDPNQGDWQYGLYMPANNVVTGIYIGTCSGACIHMAGGADGSAEGDFWYDAAAHVLKYRDNSAVKTIAVTG